MNCKDLWDLSMVILIKCILLKKCVILIWKQAQAWYENFKLIVTTIMRWNNNDKYGVLCD